MCTTNKLERRITKPVREPRGFLLLWCMLTGFLSTSFVHIRGSIKLLPRMSPSRSNMTWVIPGLLSVDILCSTQCNGEVWQAHTGRPDPAPAAMYDSARPVKSHASRLSILPSHAHTFASHQSHASVPVASRALGAGTQAQWWWAH